MTINKGTPITRSASRTVYTEVNRISSYAAEIFQRPSNDRRPEVETFINFEYMSNIAESEPSACVILIGATVNNAGDLEVSRSGLPVTFRANSAF